MNMEPLFAFHLNVASTCKKWKHWDRRGGRGYYLGALLKVIVKKCWSNSSSHSEKSWDFLHA